MGTFEEYLKQYNAENHPATISLYDLYSTLRLLRNAWMEADVDGALMVRRVVMRVMQGWHEGCIHVLRLDCSVECSPRYWKLVKEWEEKGGRSNDYWHDDDPVSSKTSPSVDGDDDPPSDDSDE